MFGIKPSPVKISVGDITEQAKKIVPPIPPVHVLPHNPKPASAPPVFPEKNHPASAPAPSIDPVHAIKTLGNSVKHIQVKPPFHAEVKKAEEEVVKPAEKKVIGAISEARKKDAKADDVAKAILGPEAKKKLDEATGDLKREADKVGPLIDKGIHDAGSGIDNATKTADAAGKEAEKRAKKFADREKGIFDRLKKDEEDAAKKAFGPDDQDQSRRTMVLLGIAGAAAVAVGLSR